MDVNGLTVEDIRPKNNIQNVGSCYPWYIALKSNESFKGICKDITVAKDRNSAKSSIKILNRTMNKLDSIFSKSVDKKIKTLLGQYNKIVCIFLKKNEIDLKGTTSMQQIIDTIRFRLKLSNEFLTYLYESNTNVDQVHENIFYYQKLADESFKKKCMFGQLRRNVKKYCMNNGISISLKNENNIEKLTHNDLSTLRQSLDEIEKKLVLYASTFSPMYNQWTDQFIFENSDEKITSNQYLNQLFNNFKCRVYVSQCVFLS